MMIDRLARWLCYTALLVPLVLIPGFFFPFVTTRAVLFRSCVAVALALLLLKAQMYRVVWERGRDPNFLALLGFISALALSAAFGVSPWRSFYGDYERMGGVWGWLHVGGFYLLLRAFLVDERSWRRFLRFVVWVGAITATLGILEHFQAALPVKWLTWWFGEPGTPILTTIGNGGMAAAYFLLVTGFALYLAMTTRTTRGKLLYAGVALATFFAILFTRNRSSLVGILAGTFVAAAFYLALTSPRLFRGVSAEALKGARSWRRLSAAVLIAGAAGALSLIAVSRYASESRYVELLPRTVQRLVQTAPRGGDASRFLQWRASWEGFLQRPVLGYGPETHHIVWGEHMNPAIYRYDPDSRWDRAHNAFAEVLATSGIVGALAVLALFAALFYSLVRAHRSGAMSAGQCALFAGAFTAYVIYLVFWFFDLNGLMLLVVASAHLSSRLKSGPIVTTGERIPIALRSKVVLSAAAVALAGTLYVHGYATLRGAWLIPRLSLERRTEASVLTGFRAMFRSPAPLSYHTLLVYSQYLRSLAPQFDAIRSDPRRRAELDEIFAQSFRIIERETRRDPRTERIALHEARIGMLAAQFYQDQRFFDSALETLRRAVAVSPRRIQTRHVLANAYLLVGRQDLAIAQLDTALRIFPPFAPTHLYLAAAYRSAGNVAASERWLLSALSAGGASPPSLFLDVATALVRAGKTGSATILLQRYLVVKYGPMWLWPRTILAQMPPDDRLMLSLLAAFSAQSASESGSADIVRTVVGGLCRGEGVPLVRADRADRDVCGRSVPLLARDSNWPLFQGRPDVSSRRSESST